VHSGAARRRAHGGSATDHEAHPVSEQSDDIAARGRAIFKRLRLQGPPPSDAQELDEPVEDEAGTAVVAPEEPPARPAPGPLPGLQDLPPLAGEEPAEDPPAEAEPAPLPSEPILAEDPVLEVAAAPAPDPEPETSPFARPLPRILAVANQKGGVGKTTTAVNLGACLADIGYRVLVVDLDPQGNASTGMGVNIRDLQGSMYDVVLHDMPVEDCVEATAVRNLFCAPSSLELAGAEIELVPAFSRELRLRKALEDVKDDYDFILIDCPPSLGLLTVNAFAAATEVVVPIQCEYYALEGLGQLLRNVNLVQKNLNQALEVSAIILVMYDARTKLADQVVNEVREHFGDKVCRQVVPRTVRLSEAPSFGQPIIAFDPSSRGAIAYRALAKEVSGGTPQRTR
jgi:chromosome partitioning protein